MSTTSTRSTERFSDRVEAYIRYRPDYPDSLIDMLRNSAGLTDNSLIADIGSGTGISSELFLRHGMRVVGVEPNEAMRAAAERLLRENNGFRSVAGTAEATGLEEKSVDMIAAGQAFHWFDRDAACREFARILRPGGKVVLFWNSRRTDGNEFLEKYEELLVRFGTDYTTINHQNIRDEDIEEFFAPEPVEKRRLYNEQVVDFEGLRGRLESSSYVPEFGHPNYEPMIDALRSLFETYAENGTVTIEYDVEIYIGSCPQRR